jgi:GT2 family glycosyltransferase
MPTKVLDLDLEEITQPITGLGDYQQALVLFRYRNRPVAKATLKVEHGTLSVADLYDGLNRSDLQPLWDIKTREYVGWIEHPSNTLPLATVAVCTRDRPQDLERCLDGFLALPDLGQEYLVIDNCPSDDSSRQITAKYGGRVRYVREDRPGLNNARNRALRDAHHEIVVFNDDDAVPDVHWLGALLQNFTDPDILCVTGLTMPLELENAAQEGFEAYSPFSRGFRRRFFYGTLTAALKAGHVGAGANMALRKNILEKIGPFDEALDSGTPTLSGGDNEIFARILGSGYHIIYEPAALSWHRHRRTWKELRHTVFGYGVGIYAVWTRRLLVEHQLGVLQAAGQYALYGQIPMLVKALLRRPNHAPIDLILAELAGCLLGTFRYLVSRSRIHH